MAEENEKKYVPPYVRETVSDSRIVLKFIKSGRTYEYTPDGVAAAYAQSLANLDGSAAGAIRDRLAEIAKSSLEEDGIPLPPIGVIAAGAKPGVRPDVAAMACAQAAFDETAAKWKDAPVGEAEFYNEAAETMFQQDVESTVYAQDGRRLDLSETDSVMSVDLPESGPCYFYTDGRMANGKQLWYKALGPFVWFGTQAQPSEN